MVFNRRVLSFLIQQAFKLSKWCLATPLKQVIDGLGSESQQKRWQRAALDISPGHPWSHGHAVTEYQLWTRYHHATGTLSFWYQDRPPDGTCTYRECVGQKEGDRECPRAQALWARLISQWESTPRKPHHLLGWLEHCANRSVPRLSPRVAAMLVARYPDDNDQSARNLALTSK